MIMPFVMISSTTKEYFVDIDRIVLDIVTLNISDILHHHNYGTMKIDDPEAEGFHVLQFTPIQYKLQY